MSARRLIALAGGLALLGLACPALAGAHATLEGSSPARGATLLREPRQVVFRFSETVEGSFGAVRVYDAQGRRVDQGDAFHPHGIGSQLAVHLQPRLPDGTYTATYRVVSVDSHVVSSGVVFSIGQATGTGQTVAQLLGGAGTGAVTSTAFAVARAVQYAAIAIGLGTLLFVLLIWGAALRAATGGSEPWRAASIAFLHRARTLMLGAALLGTVSALAAVVLEAAEAAGVSAWSALRPQILREVLSTTFGTTWSIAAACWLAWGLLCAMILRPAVRRSRILRPASLGATGLALPGGQGAAIWALLAPLAYLVLVPALSGHGSTQDPVWLMFVANVLHVAAMATWSGGLVALLVAVAAATRRLDPPARSELLSAVLRRFSALALAAVAVLAATGVLQGYLEIRHLDLVFSTGFGRAVFVKLLLLLLLIGLGAVHRRRTLPQLHAAARGRLAPGAAGWTLRRTLLAELGLIAAVLGVTGALAGYAPAVDAASGPYAATTRIGPQELQLVVDPAQVGANQVHLYLTDPRTGSQLDSAKEVTVAAALPAKDIGAIRETANKAGPGHYVVPNLALAVRGTWTLTLTVRVSDFDEYAARLMVRVR